MTGYRRPRQCNHMPKPTPANSAPANFFRSEIGTIECKFWVTDDGWNGNCEQPSIAVQAGSFEHAKSEMEIALGKYIELLLREPQRTSTGQAA